MAPVVKMMPDCKPVAGKVPGPREHLLCAKHGHVVDIKTKLVVAASLDDYKRQRAAHAADEKKKKAAAEVAQKREFAAALDGWCRKLAGPNPQKMGPDCKPVPNPKQFEDPRIQLCKTHNHVVDVKNKVVIGKTLGAFVNDWTKLSLGFG